MSVLLGNLESYALCLGSIWMLSASSSNTRPWCIHARFTHCEQPLPESCFRISRSLKLCPGGGQIPPQTTCVWRRYPGRDLLAGHVTVLRLFLLSVGVCMCPLHGHLLGNLDGGLSGRQSVFKGLSPCGDGSNSISPT